MATNIPEEQKPDAKPPKKTKWYHYVFLVIGFLWYIGGLNVLFFQDIPLLLILLATIGLFFWPIERLVNLRLKKRWSFLLLLLWLFAFNVGVAVLLLFVVPPFAISPQTTYLTEPRSKEFYGIDYQTFIKTQLDPDVPSEENGFRLLAETLGRPFFGDKLEDKYWNRLCQYLDLPTEIEPKLTFVEWRKYEETLTPEEQEIIKMFPSEMRLSLPEEAIPIVRRWLDENEAVLELFITAVEKSALYVSPMFDTDFIDSIYRSMGWHIKIRLRYYLAVGEIDKAWDDVLVIYRLAEQHHRAVWNVISAQINTGILESANQAAESVILCAGWTSAEIRLKVEEVEPFLQPFREDEIKIILRNERLTVLDYVQHLPTNAIKLINEEKKAAPNFWDWFQQKNMQA